MSVFSGIDSNCFQCIIIINLNLCQFFCQFAPKIFLDGHVFPYNVCFFFPKYSILYMCQDFLKLFCPLWHYTRVSNTVHCKIIGGVADWKYESSPPLVDGDAYQSKTKTGIRHKSLSIRDPEIRDEKNPPKNCWTIIFRELFVPGIKKSRLT